MRGRVEVTSERGQTIPEYGLVLAGIAVVLIVALLFAGGKVNHTLHRAAPEPTGTLRPPSTPSCDPSYEGACIPAPPPTLTCADLRSMHVGAVRVVGADPQGLDPDHDGIACD